MSTMKCVFRLCLVSFMIVTVTHAAKPYVVDQNGQRQKGNEIKADADGNIQLIMEDGATMRFKKGNYQYAFKPAPEDVRRLYKAYQNQKWRVIKDKAPRIFDQYKYLGWAARIAYWQGQAYYKTGDAKEALEIFREGVQFPAKEENKNKLVMGQAQCLQELERGEKAKPLLERLKEAEAPEIAAFSFLAKGRLLADQEKEKEAVLELMKTLLLFTDKQAGPHREEAKSLAVNLLEEMGDQRYQYIQENF